MGALQGGMGQIVQNFHRGLLKGPQVPRCGEMMKDLSDFKVDFSVLYEIAESGQVGAA